MRLSTIMALIGIWVSALLTYQVFSVDVVFVYALFASAVIGLREFEEDQ